VHGCQRLSRRNARRRAALHGRRARVVVADQSLWTERDPHLDQGAPRHNTEVGRAHIDAVNVVDRGAILALGLYLHLPGTTKQVDVIDGEYAKLGLQRVEDLADVDSEDARFVAVDIQIDRWARRRIG